MSREGIDDIAFVYKVTREGVVFVSLADHRPDPYIDQRLIPQASRLKVGDTLKLKFDANMFVLSFDKVEYPKAIEVVDGRLMIQASLALFPYHRTASQASLSMAYSPAVHCVYVPPSCAHLNIQRNYVYDAWIERLFEDEAQTFGADNVPVVWRIVSSRGMTPASSQFELRYMPWHRSSEATVRPSQEMLKSYIDNYTGICVYCRGHTAIVWALHIPVSDVHFSAAGLTMQLGEWVNFNCEACPRPTPERCFLEGKKFEVIDPMLPTTVVNGKVVVKASVKIPSTLWRDGDEAIVDVDYLGEVELPSSVKGSLRGGETVSMRFEKIFPSPPCGLPSWKFLGIVHPNNGPEVMPAHISTESKGEQSNNDKEEKNVNRGLLVAVEDGVGFLWDAHRHVDECVYWEISKSNWTGAKPKAGMWMRFATQRSVPFKGCSLAVVETPVRIQPLLETRINPNSHSTEIKILLEWPSPTERVTSRVMVNGVGMVEVETDRILTPPSIKGGSFATAPAGTYCAWLVKLSETAPWSISEIEMKVTDNSAASRGSTRDIRTNGDRLPRAEAGPPRRVERNEVPVFDSRRPPRNVGNIVQRSVATGYTAIDDSGTMGQQMTMPAYLPPTAAVGDQSGYRPVDNNAVRSRPPVVDTPPTSMAEAAGVRRGGPSGGLSESKEDIIRKMMTPAFGENRPVLATNREQTPSATASAQNGRNDENDNLRLLGEVWAVMEIRQILFNRKPKVYCEMKKKLDLGEV